MLDQALQNVTVIGAAGKMGSGISLLLCQEMARLEMETNPAAKIPEFQLNLVDRNQQVLKGLFVYLRAQLVRYAEKSIVPLRSYLKDRPELVDNGEIIEDFVNRALTMVNLTTDLSSAADSKLVFEAAFEKLDVKKELFTNLNKICSPETYFFTNTSSIPIGVIEEAGGIEGRLIGYHFYNPPAVQKLVETIASKSTADELKQISTELGKRLRKVLVPSNDIAGFIGNGHFIRDGLFGIRQMEELAKTTSIPEAIYMINRVSQDFMVRPMGIFQLIDYVGLDVFQMILETMDKYIDGENLSSTFVQNMLKAEVAGGQYHDGSQKDGFLKYQKGRIIGVYDPDKNAYLEVTPEFTEKCDAALGALPDGHYPWKALSRDRGKDEKFKTYFGNLFNTDNQGSKLAKDYLLNSREISKKLVGDGIAADSNDVSQVLINGFYHLYGPENSLF
jgi:3-hydroxyacyl-CoA dehydrogenase